VSVLILVPVQAPVAGLACDLCAREAVSVSVLIRVPVQAPASGQACGLGVQGQLSASLLGRASYLVVWERAPVRNRNLTQVPVRTSGQPCGLFAERQPLQELVLVPGPGSALVVPGRHSGPSGRGARVRASATDRARDPSRTQEQAPVCGLFAAERVWRRALAPDGMEGASCPCGRARSSGAVPALPPVRVLAPARGLCARFGQRGVRHRLPMQPPSCPCVPERPSGQALALVQAISLAED
jgi:hypothetical protein